MNRRTFLQATVLIASASVTQPAWSQEHDEVVPVMPFGFGGSKNMLYDSRQRPQAVYLDDKVYIGFKGGGTVSRSGKAKTRPMLIRYDPRRRRFSEPVTFGKASSDHHFCPIVWADEANSLHLLYGCHRTPGTHLVSNNPAEMWQDKPSWVAAAEIAPKLSYPTVFRIHGDKELIYYRTDGHSSSWTYRISDDNGRSWIGPSQDVTDLDRINHPEWSSYQTKLPSKDGKSLHVVFTDYDDVKSNDPQRLFNPRYNQPVSNEWKYNLSYVKIDLHTHVVRNADGEILTTPIDIETARAKCQIWDTQWRGAGIPPGISLDEDGEPTFLHVLSEDNLQTHNYYYVRREKGKWVQTRISRSNHQWNSGYLARDSMGVLHAYLIVGDHYLDSTGAMDDHGGGRIEEWVSPDKGRTWAKRRDIAPDPKKYANWRFNNIQPVLHSDGSAVDGMLLYCGWQDKEKPQAVAFLLDESNGR